MAYDHHHKAGNPGDVIKHTALIAAANLLMNTCGDTFHYADTFAGYPHNPIKAGGEWQQGIGIFNDLAPTFGNTDLEFWHSLWSCPYGLEGSIYPGSSTFIRKLCLKNKVSFKPRLWDVSSTVISQLTDCYTPYEAEIYPRPATLEDFKELKPDLLLLDPPDFENVEEILQFFAVADNVLLWLPVVYVQDNESATSHESFMRCLEIGTHCITVMWGGLRSTRGCRLICKLHPEGEVAFTEAVKEITRRANWQYSSDKINVVSSG